VKCVVVGGRHGKMSSDQLTHFGVGLDSTGMMSSLLESTFVLRDFVSTHSHGKIAIQGIRGLVRMERGVGGEINAGSLL
jgi:hypothetical protein